MNTSFSCKLCSETDLSKFRSKIIRGKTYYEKCCRACEAKKARKYYASHKIDCLERQKKYLQKNFEIVKAKKKEYDKNRYLLVKDDKIAQSKSYAKNNRDVINSAKKLKRKLDPAYRLRHYISGRIRKILKQSGFKKNNSCIKYLDYSFSQLKDHLEKQFETWMTWDNHGNYNPLSWDDNNVNTWTWQLDHIIPQSDLPYTSMEDENFKKCWSLENLRPLNAKVNNFDGTNRTRHSKPTFKVKRFKD